MRAGRPGHRSDTIAPYVTACPDLFGRLDILVNSAGIARDAVVWKMTDEAWAEVIETDLTACL